MNERVGLSGIIRARLLPSFFQGIVIPSAQRQLIKFRCSLLPLWKRAPFVAFRSKSQVESRTVPGCWRAFPRRANRADRAISSGERFLLTPRRLQNVPTNLHRRCSTRIISRIDRARTEIYGTDYFLRSSVPGKMGIRA